MANGNGVPVDKSGTIATGGTAQSFLAYDQTRQGFSIYNSSVGNLYLNFVGGVAVTTPASSLTLPPGSFYETPPNMRPVQAVSIIGATTAQAFSATEW